MSADAELPIPIAIAVAASRPRGRLRGCIFRKLNRVESPVQSFGYRGRLASLAVASPARSRRRVPSQTSVIVFVPGSEAGHGIGKFGDRVRSHVTNNPSGRLIAPPHRLRRCSNSAIRGVENG